MVNLFYKDLWTSPKDDRGRRGDTNGSLLANRAEVESLLIASKKSFWQTLSQYVVTHKGAASVLAVSCMTLLGGGAIFAWHSLHSQAQQTSSLAVASSSSQTGQTSSSDKSKQSSSRASESSSNSSSQSQNASSEAKTPAMDVDAIRIGDFQASKVTGFLTVVML